MPALGIDHFGDILASNRITPTTPRLARNSPEPVLVSRVLHTWNARNHPESEVEAFRGDFYAALNRRK